MRGGRKKNDEDVVVTRDYVKTTYLLDPVIKQNLQYLALSRQKEQSDIVREALHKFIVDAGLDLKRPPHFQFGEL